jgi:hypothetical protein
VFGLAVVEIGSHEVGVRGILVVFHSCGLCIFIYLLLKNVLVYAMFGARLSPDSVLDGHTRWQCSNALSRAPVRAARGILVVFHSCGLCVYVFLFLFLCWFGHTILTGQPLRPSPAPHSVTLSRRPRFLSYCDRVDVCSGVISGGCLDGVMIYQQVRALV